ncbi:hypothetical protein [Methylobacterium sp. J-068]|nr:hypothetical protein [Methylobacterium sp. J-068]MCJ2035588.1 hypothetical protein [Methylobacterium sp. J-068]
MLKIDIEIDISAFEKNVDDHRVRAFQPAVVESLNKAGEARRDAVRKGG